MMSSNRKIGQYGEDLACKFLTDNGYKVIERNVHFSKFCEIDIIAKYKNELVFVEVKTRKNDKSGSPFEAITYTKYKHLKQGIFMFLSNYKEKYANFRIDVIGIVLEPETKIEHLKHISL